MRLASGLAISLAVAAVATTTARAEPDNLGGYKLGQKLKKKVKPKPLTLYGCTGHVAPTVYRGVVASVTFTQEMETSCEGADDDQEAQHAALVAAISKDMGSQPIEGSGGVNLWEGASGSIILDVADYGPTGPTPYTITLGAPGPGAKRTCYPDDGFAPFFAELKTALGNGSKPADLVRFFKFPFRDEVGEVGSYKNAKAFTAKAGKKLLTDENREAIVAEEAPYCDHDEGTYRIFLGSGLLYAVRTGDTWQLGGVAEREMY